MKMSYHVFPVGRIRKGPDADRIEIFDTAGDGLLGVDAFSHLIVLGWFHQNDTGEKRSTLSVHPRGNPSNPLTGVFGTRSPSRPNLIAHFVCKVLSIQGLTIYIEPISALDQTPVLDIKPYIPRSDAVPDATVPAWVEKDILTIDD
jgi:tRNA-Thr(GGU) m(6)t(6)A37 methyltransferase TsaA